jgi:hypothetical protein
MTETIDRFRDWDAAYVLGALSTDDRRAFERHLVTCPECTAAVAQLAGLPGILGKLSVDEAVALMDETRVASAAAPDSHLRDEVHTPGLVQRLAVAAKRRRRRTRIGLLLSGVAVLAIFTVGGVAVAANQAPRPVTVAMSPLNQHALTASLTVTQKGWGTRFDWSCNYLGDTWEGESVSYDLVVTDKTGKQSTVATWSSSGPHAKGLTASSSIPTDNIRNVEIRLTGTTTPLLEENL